MRLPPGLTEEAALAAVERCVGALAGRHPTQMLVDYDEDDVAQEIRLFALIGLKHYDGTRPLDDYLFRHVRNRLLGLAYDKYWQHRPFAKRRPQ